MILRLKLKKSKSFQELKSLYLEAQRRNKGKNLIRLIIGKWLSYCEEPEQAKELSELVSDINKFKDIIFPRWDELVSEVLEELKQNIDFQKLNDLYDCARPGSKIERSILNTKEI